MVDVHHQMCVVAGCTTQAKFGFEGRCRKFCSDHKMPGMVSLDESLRHKCAKYGCEKQSTEALFLAAVLGALAAKTLVERHHGRHVVVREKFAASTFKSKLCLYCAPGHDTHLVVHINHARFQYSRFLDES